MPNHQNDLSNQALKSNAALLHLELDACEKKASWEDLLFAELRSEGCHIPKGREPKLAADLIVAAKSKIFLLNNPPVVKNEFKWPRIREAERAYVGNPLDSEDGFYEAFSRQSWGGESWIVGIRWRSDLDSRKRRPKTAESLWTQVESVFRCDENRDVYAPLRAFKGSIEYLYKNGVGKFCTWSLEHKMLLNNKRGWGIALELLHPLRKLIPDTAYEVSYLDSPRKVDDRSPASLVDSHAYRFKGEFFELVFLKEAQVEIPKAILERVAYALAH